MADDDKDLSDLQSLIDRSTRTASPAVADSVAYAARQMSAREFMDFWSSVKTIAMATVGPRGQPHLAPVHARISGTKLRFVAYDNTVRRHDLGGNPRVAFTAWSADRGVAILYGRAREIPDSRRPARSSQRGTPRYVVEIEVSLTRVYAMRPPRR